MAKLPKLCDIYVAVFDGRIIIIDNSNWDGFVKVATDNGAHELDQDLYDNLYDNAVSLDKYLRQMKENGEPYLDI